MIKILNQRIFENDIYDLTKDSRTLIVYAKRPYLILADHRPFGGMLRIELDESDKETLNEIKKVLIQRAIKNSDPHDRVCDFEWWSVENGYWNPDFEKRDRLIKERTTNQDREKEKEYLIETIEIAKKINEPYDEFKKRLREVMFEQIGGF